MLKSQVFTMLIVIQIVNQVRINLRPCHFLGNGIDSISYLSVSVCLSLSLCLSSFPSLAQVPSLHDAYCHPDCKPGANFLGEQPFYGKWHRLCFLSVCMSLSLCLPSGHRHAQVKSLHHADRHSNSKSGKN